VSIFISIGMQLLRGRLGEFKKAKKRVIGVIYSFTFVFPMLVSGNSFRLFSPLYSTISLPIIYPFYILSWISFLTVPFSSVLKLYGSAITSYLTVLERINIEIPLGNWNMFMTFTYYVCLLGWYYFRDCGLTNLQNICLGILTASIAINPLPCESFFVEEVTFINVGQGDSILIRSKTNTILIDTGGNTGFDIATNVIIPYLRKRNIYHLDYLIGTHDDADHIGGKDSLIHKYKVKKYVDNIDCFPLTCGNITLTNLNVYESLWEEENDTSLVLYAEFMNRKWIFTGDASQKIEKKIIEDNPSLDCDILKVGHHGSKTSSADVFIKTITPEVGIISVGANNKYGHPNDEALETLKKYNVTIRRTDIEGTITYKRYVFPL
ncbi:MAG: MBL fold metallo-hydrolase, partial [Bacilli bacterium]|nr:MBL fold metallo-hydrolase [Bacilli bacterium]